MWSAALPCRLTGSAVGAAAVAILAFAASASGTQSAPSAPSGQVWAIALPAGVSSVSQARLQWLAGKGVNTVVTVGMPQKPLARLAVSARRARITVIAARTTPPKRACAARAGTLQTCAALVRSPAAAVKLARRSVVDYVIVHVTGPKQLRFLRGGRFQRSRIVALLPPQTAAAWRTGVAYASADSSLDLGVSSRLSSPALNGFAAALPRQRTAAAAVPAAPGALLVVGRSSSSVALRWTASPGDVEGYGVYRDGTFVLNVSGPAITLTGLTCGRAYAFDVDAYRGSSRSERISTTASTDACPGPGGGGGGGGGTPADAVPPTAPTGLAKSSSTQTSIRVIWTAATDNVGVAGYRLYRGGALVATSLIVDYTFSGLTCGTSYPLEVAAYDAAGNSSARTALTSATSACSGGGDSTAPSLPGALSATGTTTTSISVSWGASTDNVGVSGYGLYRNNASTGSTPSTSATFGGLVCGSSYSLAVDAYDAAGNRSAKRSLTAATAACPPSSDTQAPSVPQGMAFTTVAQTTVGLTWLASTDNVGVAGYRLLRDGASVATVPTPGYTFVGLTCGTTYTFTLQAYDAAGNSSNGAEATGSTTTAACSGGGSPPPPPPPPGPTPPPAGTINVAPGGSLDQAYSQAQDGWVIQLSADDYGIWRPAGGSKQVTIKGVTGTRFRQLYSQFDNVTFDGLDIDAGGIKTSGGAAFESHGDNATFKNGRIGNVSDEKAALISGTNFTFDNVFFHDAVLKTDGVHMECVYAIVVPGFTIRNSTFRNCAVMDLFFTYGDWWSPRPPAYGNVTIENNQFESSRFDNGVCCHYYGLYIGNVAYPAPGTLNGWKIRNNWFENEVAVAPSLGSGNIFCGNTGSPLNASWRTTC
jgi:chitodextrinase